jgi:hypothetical protein
MTSLWYFETWSPHGGIAFASLRRPAANGELDVKREAVVALMPPYWRPTPVALSTALRAERGPFQVGFFDPQGVALGFKTLADLVAVVRQAYIAAGSGRPPGGEGPEGLPPLSPLPEPGQPSDWPFVLDALLSEDRGRLKAEAFADGVVQKLSGVLTTLFKSFADRTLERMATDGRTRVEDIVAWCQVLDRMGLGDQVDAYVMKGPTPRLTFWRWLLASNVRGQIARGLLFRVPDPIVDGWTENTLGDVLAYKLAGRGRLEGMAFVYFAVLLFAAAGLTSAANGPAGGPSPDEWLMAVQREATLWLFANTPSVVANSAARDALERWSPT